MGFESLCRESPHVREHSRLPSQQLSHISSGGSGFWFPLSHTLHQISLSTRLILILGIFRVTYPEITLILVPSSVLLRSFARGGKVARPGRTGLLTTQTNQRRCRPVLMGTCAVAASTGVVETHSFHQRTKQNKVKFTGLNPKQYIERNDIFCQIPSLLATRPPWQCTNTRAAPKRLERWICAARIWHPTRLTFSVDY